MGNEVKSLQDDIGVTPLKCANNEITKDEVKQEALEVINEETQEKELEDEKVIDVEQGDEERERCGTVHINVEPIISARDQEQSSDNIHSESKSRKTIKQTG